MDEPANLPDKRIGVDIELAAARAVQNIQTIQKASARAAPITRAFVATAIRGVKFQETIETAQHFVNDTNAAVGVRFVEQRRGQDTGGNPRSPVVRSTIRAGDIKRNPPEIIALENRPPNATLEFELGPATHKRRDAVQLRTEQVDRPSHRDRALAREQIHNGFIDIRQSDRLLLRANMRGQTP